jgi:hypothetical protein
MVGSLTKEAAIVQSLDQLVAKIARALNITPEEAERIVLSILPLGVIHQR